MCVEQRNVRAFPVNTVHLETQAPVVVKKLLHFECQGSATKICAAYVPNPRFSQESCEFESQLFVFLGTCAL